MTKINFDVEKVLSELPEDDRGFEPLPDGWYEAQVNASSVKTTKAGNGEYLELEFDIIGDDYKGRKVWTRLNLKNPNKQTVEIAQKDFAKFCKAIKLSFVGEPAELHGKPVQIKVTYRKGEGEYGPTNDIRDYKASTLGIGIQKTEEKDESSQTKPSWSNT